MKAFYSLWPNFEYIDKLVDAGIDTLLVTAHDLPSWDTPSGYYDTREIVIQTISRYKGRCKIFLVPLWARPWIEIPVMQRWQTEKGRSLKGTPCPTSMSYIRSRVVTITGFANDYKLDGVIWDLEHLEHQTRSDVIPFYNSLRNPEHRCYCATCIQYTMENLWKVHAGLIRKELEQSGIPIHGQMPYSGGWTMRQFPGDLHHFTEETYQRDVGFIERFKWERTWKKAKVSPRVIPGVWCEWHHTEDKLLRYIKKIYHKYGHFWLYSHEFFGNRIPNPHVNYPMKGPATEYFFRGLSGMG